MLLIISIAKNCSDAALSLLFAGSMVGQDLSKTFTEEDWGDIEKVQDPYNKSKIMAEKAAWDFVKELPGWYC